MKTVCKKLKIDIKRESESKDIDPYKHSFKPSDLGLISSDYGAFSDHCKKGTTRSSRWCGCGKLKRVQKRPFKYILVKKIDNI